MLPFRVSKNSLVKLYRTIYFGGLRVFVWIFLAKIVAQTDFRTFQMPNRNQIPGWKRKCRGQTPHCRHFLLKK